MAKAERTYKSTRVFRRLAKSTLTEQRASFLPQTRFLPLHALKEARRTVQSESLIKAYAAPVKASNVYTKKYTSEQQPSMISLLQTPRAFIAENYSLLHGAGNIRHHFRRFERGDDVSQMLQILDLDIDQEFKIADRAVDNIEITDVAVVARNQV